MTEQNNQEETAVQESAKSNSFKLDYTLNTPEQRMEYTKKLLEQLPKEKISNKYLEIISDYILEAMSKEERKTKKILTDNRMVTVNKRETSFEGLISKLENGEDGIYNMLSNNKNVLLTPQISITPQDIERIPELKELCDAIKIVEAQEKKAVGKSKFLLKKQLIEMRRDQYIIKNAFYQPPVSLKTCNSPEKIDFDEKITIHEDGTVSSDGLISLFNPTHVSAILCNYSRLKEDSWGKFSEDTFYLMEEVDELVEQTLKNKYPLYYDLLVYKIDGCPNLKIQEQLYKDYGIKHSVEYISSLWRNKIPKLIAEQAQENYLMWYYTTQERGKWKRCSRCGQVKLAHNRFFSKNKTSKDGFYSICKECRNKKNK